MRTLHAALMLCFLWTMTLGAQDFQLSGKVISDANEPIAFANVLIFTAPDSTYVGGTSADDFGKFTLDVTEGLYKLYATYLGNNSQTITLDIQKSIAIGALVIKENTQNLDEVIVTAKKPTLTRTEDRIIFKVENTVLSQGNSWDILKATPGVILNQDNFLIKGSNATVFLNNRPIKLTSDEIRSLLEGLSGAVIESVEVIPNPPAQYDANTGPILNIITSTPVTPGYKGNLNGTYTQAIFPKYTLGTSHFFKSGKFNVLGNYNLGINKNVGFQNREINFLNDQNQTLANWDGNSQIINKILSHNGLINIDYDIDDRNKMTLSTNILVVNNRESDIDMRNIISNPAGVVDSTFTTAVDVFSDYSNYSSDLTYTHQFKDGVSSLTLNGHYTQYNINKWSGLISNYFDSSNNFIRQFGFQNPQDNTIEIVTSQMDWTLPLAKGTFDWGGKFSNITSKNINTFQNFIGVDPAIDASLNDNFVYDETVYAAYLQWRRGWDKFSFKLGVRGEFTDAVGTSIALNQVNKQSFFEPFPSVFLKYSINDANSLSFDFRRDLQRPNYNNLNPFRVFFNESDFTQGNPRLQPYFPLRFNLNYSLNDEFFIDVYYRDNDRYINDLVFQDNQLFDLRELYQNVLESTSYGLDFTLSKSLLDFWYVYTYVSLFHEDETFLAEESGNVPFTNEYEGIYAYLANYLTLSADGTFNGEITATYLSGFLFGSYISEEQLNVTLGLTKTFWDNKLSLSLAAEDIFRTNAPFSRSRYLNQDNGFVYQPETRFIRFGATYKFGNKGLEANEKELNKIELDRLKEE